MPEWTEHLRPRLAPLRLDPAREAEIIEELSQHLDERYEELRSSGTGDDEAHRLAILELLEPGALAGYMQALRQANAPPPIAPGAPSRSVPGDLWQDLQYAGRTLRKQPGFALVKWMFERAAAAMTPAGIAEAANARGWRTKELTQRRTGKRRGGNLWTARQVIATLRNPVYLGMFRDKNDFRIGHHEAIVTHELFAAVAAQLESRRTRTPGKHYKIDWQLKGRITCAVCSRPMSPHTIRYRNFLYRYYRCRSTAGGQRPCGHQVSAHALESALLQNMEMLWHLRLNMKQLRDHVESVVYDHRDQSARKVDSAT